MRLKSLQMQGFKSFPNKVELTFDTGMTAIVGPNGSGKSNISDAVRWVLGEQSSKNLRGNRMEDVIFLGTEFKNASAFASVTLTIDNSDRGLNVENDEVSINRKLYRSGESEYNINGKSVRLKDVSELFMDTGLGKDGYSIIGQGKIAEIVSSRSSERREIFEEACGISKFRYKKNEAEKKLALSEENMLRLNDIIVELESRLEPLRKQSEKAKLFLELSEKRKSVEVSIWIFKINDLRSVLEGVQERLNITQSQYNDLENQLESREEKIQSGYIKMQESSAKVDAFQRKMIQSQQKLSEDKSNIVIYQNDIHHSQNRVLELKRSKEENILNEETLKSKVISLKSLKKSIEDTLNETITQLNSLNNKLLELENKFNELNIEIVEISNKINSNKQNIQKENLTLISMQTIIEETNSQIKNLETSNLEFKILCERYKQEIIEVTKNLESCEVNQIELNNQLMGFQKLLSNKESKLNTVKETQEKVSLEFKEKTHKMNLLKDLENSMEGFSKAVKLIMKSVKKGTLKGIYGTVSQMMETSKEYITAIETALQGVMQSIIVQDENTAKSCINYLKSVNGGRSTFLPLSSIKSQEFHFKDVEKEFGFIGIASDLVSCDSQFDNIKENLLGRIVIMDNLECATVIAKKYSYKFKIVTLDGQVINVGGSFTGGSAINSGGVFSRKQEIETLNQELEKLSIEEKILNSDVLCIKNDLSNIHNEIDVLNQSILENKSKEVQFKADLKRLNDTIAQYEGNLNSFDTQKATLLSKVEIAKTNEISSKSNLKELEKALSSLEDDLSIKEIEKKSLIDDRTSLLEEVSHLKLIQVEKSKDLSTLQNTLESTNNALVQLDIQNQNIDVEISNKEKLIVEKQQYILDTQNLEEELTVVIESLKSEITSWQEVHKQQEEQVTQLRLSLRELNTDKENVSRELIRLEEKKKNVQCDYANIVSQLFDTYEMTFSEAEQFATPIEDIQSAQRELSQLKVQIKSLGNVNVSAIDEFNEVSDRYKFLSGQLADTRKSKAELENLIESLTKDMKNIFEENFYKINESFKRIFVELFGGGSAELVLTNKEDILNSGIEILVSPPGKVIKSLISLSGGEKALVSIAIYFAILTVKPSPFCILDEIDAPLDEVNVRKYAVYLNRFIEKTQFIVVTHRRGTMETANVLYGVTMQKDGISKLLKMEQKDIPVENF